MKQQKTKKYAKRQMVKENKFYIIVHIEKFCLSGGIFISRIISVTPNDDYTMLIEFEHGNQILFNMQRMIKTIPYNALNDLQRFKNITVEDKALCWNDTETAGRTMVPVRLTIDNILFAIRD